MERLLSEERRSLETLADRELGRWLSVIGHLGGRPPGTPEEPIRNDVAIAASGSRSSTRILPTLSSISTHTQFLYETLR